MFSIRQATLIGLGAAFLMAGCGQTAANAPLAAGSGKAVTAAGTIRADQTTIASAIKAQLERRNPDNMFIFRDLSVSALPVQNVHTFRGIADASTFFGHSEYTVYGRFDLTTRVATIAYRVLLHSNRGHVLYQDKSQADEVFDVAADAPTVQQAKLDIKEQLETAGVRLGSYSVLSGITVRDLDPTTANKTFTAHERVVGHGWEIRNSLEGTYDPTTRKAMVIKRQQISSTGRPWPMAA